MNSKYVKVGPGAYDRWRVFSLGALTEGVEHRLVWEMIGDPGQRLVLDAGCGDGLLARQICAKGARVIGVDPAPDMLAAAVAQSGSGSDGPWWACGRAQALPFKNECCGLALVVTVICFLSASDARKAMAETARVPPAR